MTQTPVKVQCSFMFIILPNLAISIDYKLLYHLNIEGHDPTYQLSRQMHNCRDVNINIQNIERIQTKDR